MSLSSLDQEIIQKWVILIKQKNLMPFLLRHLSSLFTSFGLKAVIPAPIGQKPGFFFFLFIPLQTPSVLWELVQALVKVKYIF